MRVIYGVDSRWEISKSYFPVWFWCLWPQDYFSINFTQSSEYRSDAPMILQLPSLERKRTHGVSGTKDVFQLRDLPQCGEESARPSCCRNGLSCRIKKEHSKRIEGKGTNFGQIWSRSLTVLSVRMCLTDVSGFGWWFMQLHFFFHFSQLLPSGHYKTVFWLRNFLNPGVSVKRVTTEMILHFISWLLLESYIKSRVFYLSFSALISYWHWQNIRNEGWSFWDD